MRPVPAPKVPAAEEVPAVVGADSAAAEGGKAATGEDSAVAGADRAATEEGKGAADED
jgi:hypothetical protein